MINRDEIEFWGVNNRLQPLQAIVANKELSKIEKVIEKRNNNARLMDKLFRQLSPYVIITKRPKGYLETFALYMCLVNKRDSLIRYLRKKKIETKIHYPIPLNRQKAAKKLKLNQKDFNVANYQSKKLITLPIHQYLNRENIIFIAKEIKNFYKNR